MRENPHIDSELTPEMVEQALSQVDAILSAEIASGQLKSATAIAAREAELIRIHAAIYAFALS